MNIIKVISLTVIIILGYAKTEKPLSKTIKTYSITNSFGVENQELKYSTVINYNINGSKKDSVIYSHSISLSDKYSYGINKQKNQALFRDTDKKSLLHYKYTYNIDGRLMTETLWTNYDSLMWRKFYKYNNLNKVIKTIRYNPNKSLNQKSKIKNQKSKTLLWGETFSYDSSKTVFEHKELYDGNIIEITSYKIDSLNKKKKINEYYDPSMIDKTVYRYNESGSLKEKVITGRFGEASSSSSYKYDIYNRLVKENIFDSNGLLNETLLKSYSDTENRIVEIRVDNKKKIISKKELFVNDFQQPLIIEYFSKQNSIIQKKSYKYNLNGYLMKIYDYNLLYPKSEKKYTPINIITYEYD